MTCDFPQWILGGPRWTQRPGLPVTSATHTTTPLAHRWPTVANRCQERTTACTAHVCCVSRACNGLVSIIRAHLLDLLLMWPVHFLCHAPVIHAHFSSVYNLPLHLLLFSSNYITLQVNHSQPNILNIKVLVLVFMFIYLVRLVRIMSVMFRPMQHVAHSHICVYS